MTGSDPGDGRRRRIVIEPEPERPISGREYAEPQPNANEAGPPRGSRSRRNRNIAIGLAVIVVLVFLAFRSQGPSEQEQAAQAAAGECLDAYDDALEVLSELKSRTSVGLTYTEHDALVTDLTTESDLVANRDLGVDCAALVTGPLEEANDLYIGVGIEWDECINDYFCDSDYDFNPEGRWMEAEAITDQIQSDLELLEEISAGDRDSGDYPSPASTDESDVEGQVS